MITAPVGYSKQPLASTGIVKVVVSVVVVLAVVVVDVVVVVLVVVVEAVVVVELVVVKAESTGQILKPTRVGPPAA